MLKEKETIFDGIGTPDLQLTLYLLLTFILIALILVRGVKSSGKAAYFLGITDNLFSWGLFLKKKKNVYSFNISSFVHLVVHSIEFSSCCCFFYSSFPIPHHGNIVFPLGYATWCMEWYCFSVQTRMAITLLSKGKIFFSFDWHSF